jgi:phospholipid/cholesterol/gamma-HCH transport system permease protein
VASDLKVPRQEPRKSARHFRFALGHLRLFWGTLSRLSALGRWPVRQVLLKQIYFTGTESLLTISLVGFLAGLIVVTEITNLVGRNELLTIQILIWIIVRELGPLLSAIVIIDRSSSAFASELSAMQVSGEIKSLRCMAISPLSYLVVPRVVAMTLASIALTFYFQLVAIGTGSAVITLRLDIPLHNDIVNFFETINFSEIVASFLKSMVFGVLISVVSCYHGLRTKSAATEIPQAVSQAVIRSLLAVFVGDGVITMLAF